MTKTLSVQYIRQFRQPGTFQTDFGLLAISEADIFQSQDPSVTHVVIEEVEEDGERHWHVIGFAH